MSKTVCSYPGCVAWATSRGRCSQHRWRKTTRATRAQRTKALRRTQGRCVDCGAPATVAHHVIERQHGGADTADNLVALCDDCHRRRHGGRIGSAGGGVASPTGRMTAGARGAPRNKSKIRRHPPAKPRDPTHP